MLLDIGKVKADSPVCQRADCTASRVYNTPARSYLPPRRAASKNIAHGNGGFALERLLRATVNTWNGLRAATRSERAFREELVVLAMAIPLAFVISQGSIYALTLIAMVLLVLVVELLNTAMEKLSDFVAPAHDERIGRIKDMGSAAVGLALLIAGITWLLALAERLGLL
jgi:diacylglycerol kinase (ATP)